MYSTAYMMRFINQLPNNQMFYNRQLLQYGKRSTVDNLLSHLAKIGIIIRLARGVYVKDSSDFRRPSVLEIAQFKAKAFGRRIRARMSDTARSMGLLNTECDKLECITDGYSSSFATMTGERIYFRRSAARKVLLNDDLHGSVIKALWFGRKPVDLVVLAKLLQAFDTKQIRALREMAEWMPAWLANEITKPVWFGRREKAETRLKRYEGTSWWTPNS